MTSLALVDESNASSSDQCAELTFLFVLHRLPIFLLLELPGKQLIHIHGLEVRRVPGLRQLQWGWGWY